MKSSATANIRIYASLAEVITMSCGASFSSSRAEKILFSNSNNNELLFINLATVMSRQNSTSSPWTLCATLTKNTSNIKQLNFEHKTRKIRRLEPNKRTCHFRVDTIQK
jgi:hypothetical protein